MSTLRAASASLALGLATLDAAAPLGQAQAGQAEIAGEVRDSSGARVAGAQVTAVHTTTERRVTAATSDAGLFLLPSLRPGPYRLEVEAAGFRSFRRDGLEIRTGERVRVDVALEIGTFAEGAVVTVDVPLIKTERSDVGQVGPNREDVQRP